MEIPAPGSVRDVKRQLRAHLRLLRGEMPTARRDALSAAITAHVLALPAWASARTVMLYLALPEEVDTDRLAAAALEQGKRLCLPRVQREGQMEAVHVESFNGIAFAGLNLPVRQPLPGVGEVVDPREIDLNLVPCVGIDRSGVRLGLGGGHYDRFLGRTGRQTLSLALAFDMQVLDALPREPHDCVLDGCVTESGVFRTGPVQGG